MYRWRVLDRVDVRHSKTRHPSVLSIKSDSCRRSRIPRVSIRYTRPFHRFATRWRPLMVVTRSLISTMSETARSVMESMTTIESCAFSSKKATSSSRIFVDGRSKTSSSFVHVAGTPLLGEYTLEEVLDTVSDPHAFERFRQRIHAEVDAIPR